MDQRHNSAFTFHYVSTYTVREMAAKKNSVYIYIPLCFYLYGRKIILPVSEACIYIPLCFYLYANMQSQVDGFNKIYIPLCFYLYIQAGFDQSK